MDDILSSPPPGPCEFLCVCCLWTEKPARDKINGLFGSQKEGEKRRSLVGIDSLVKKNIGKIQDRVFLVLNWCDFAENLAFSFSINNTLSKQKV